MPDTPVPPRFVDSLRIASPCDVPWSAMAGDDRVRRCGQCDRLVYQVARLTADEVEALFESGGEAPCLQLRRRADGTVITADCPVGLRRLRVRRRTRLAAAAFATLMTACGGGRAESSSGQVLSGRIGLVSSDPAPGTRSPAPRPRIIRRPQPQPPDLRGAPGVSCPIETGGKVAPPEPPVQAPASHPGTPRLP